MYQYYLFDLDGTLTDPALGITNSVMHALEKFGIEVQDRTQLYKYIGPPLMDSFTQYAGLSESDARLAINYYREYFAPTGKFENVVYDGIAQMLAELKSMGKTLIVATSKPEPFSVDILKHFELYDYFDFVAGSTLDETRTRKDEVIEYALKSMNVDKSRALMIGDREHDIIGARKNGLKSMGVLYGYGSKEELMKAGADYMVSDVKDIVEFAKGELS